MRHNAVRDCFGRFMVEAKCRDVKIEPHLIPVNAENFDRSVNTQEEARLDISAVGVWSAFERTFFDVRVTHPNCDSNVAKPLPQIFAENEQEKKRKYEPRVIEVEKGSFTPVVLATSGGMGPEAENLIQRLADKIAEKTSERRSQILSHLRTKLRFALLRCTLVALRGVRGKMKKGEETNGYENISFNLLPRANSYEG